MSARYWLAGRDGFHEHDGAPYLHAAGVRGGRLKSRLTPGARGGIAWETRCCFRGETREAGQRRSRAVSRLVLGIEKNGKVMQNARSERVLKKSPKGDGRSCSGGGGATGASR